MKPKLFPILLIILITTSACQPYNDQNRLSLDSVQTSEKLSDNYNQDFKSGKNFFPISNKDLNSKVPQFGKVTDNKIADIAPRLYNKYRVLDSG